MGDVKVLLVDDHNIVKQGLRVILESHDSITVVDEAGNGKEAIEKLRDGLNVDIVVIDINMPEMNGIQAAEIIVKEFVDLRILALTMLNEEYHIRKMLKAGAHGYILKNSSKDELLNAVLSIHKGEHYFSKEATNIIMMDMVNGAPQNTEAPAEEVYLTEREKDIIKLIAKEFTNAEIAEKLFISVRTVDAHRRNLLQKIGARNTAGLVVYAIEHNLH
jgi:DNA-binding NarL/FixJ family response regulator